MQQQINLNEMSLIELKALAYDRIAMKEQTERELVTINEQIRVKLTEQQKGNGQQKPEEAELIN